MINPQPRGCRPLLQSLGLSLLMLLTACDQAGEGGSSPLYDHWLGTYQARPSPADPTADGLARRVILELNSDNRFVLKSLRDQNTAAGQAFVGRGGLLALEAETSKITAFTFNTQVHNYRYQLDDRQLVLESRDGLKRLELRRSGPDSSSDLPSEGDWICSSLSSSDTSRGFLYVQANAFELWHTNQDGASSFARGKAQYDAAANQGGGQLLLSDFDRQRGLEEVVRLELNFNSSGDLPRLDYLVEDGTASLTFGAMECLK